MNRPTIWVLFSLSVFGLFSFQNCAKKSTLGERDLASLAEKSVSGEMMDKQIIVKMKSSSAQQAMSVWAANNGLFNLNADDPMALSQWDSENMSSWGWNGSFSVGEMIATINADAIASDVEYAEPNYILQASVARSIVNIPLASQVVTQAVTILVVFKRLQQKI